MMISCVEGWKKWVHKCPSQKLRWNISAHSVSVKAMSSAAEQKNTAKIGKNQLFISKVVGGIIALILCLYSLGCGPTYFRIFEFVTRLTALWRVFCATLQFAQLKIQALTHTHPHTHFCNAKRMQEGAWQTSKRMCMCVCLCDYNRYVRALVYKGNEFYFSRSMNSGSPNFISKATELVC